MLKIIVIKEMLLAIISDIHSDFPSLEKALGKIRKNVCDRIVCLGDIVGYSYHYSDSLDGRDPDSCCELVREQCQIVIRGNHDLHALRMLPENHRQLGMPGNWYDLPLNERASISSGRFWLYADELEHVLSASSGAYLTSLPEHCVISTGEFGILCTHFIAPDITGATQGSPASHKDFRKHLKMIRQKRCLLGIAGHAHPEGYVQVSRRYYRMNYFRRESLLEGAQVIIGPAISRGESRRGYLLLDTEKREFAAIPLETN